MIEIATSFPHLFYGYCVIWGLMVAYLVWLHIKLRKIEKELSERGERK